MIRKEKSGRCSELCKIEGEGWKREGEEEGNEREKEQIERERKSREN